MPEVQTPAQTANNIVQGITNKANGKAPATPPINKQEPPVNPAAGDQQKLDPNAGKEKYVVEGREVWLSPEQARAYVQKGIAFEPRMDQLARLQQESMQFQRALLTDPGTVLFNIAKQANVSMKEMVQRVLKGNASDDVKQVVGEWYYEHEVEPRKLSPEQLKAREDAKWRTEREQADQQSKDDAIRQENQQRVNQALVVLKAQIAEAMKESGLPNNDSPLGVEMAARVAKTMQLARRQGQALTPKQAIEHVKRQIKSVQAAYYETLEDDALVSELGGNLVDKIKKHLVKLANANGAKPPVNGTARPTPRGERKTESMDDFHDYLNRRKKEG